jgi:TetR/AcrR family transcriptional regulator
MVTARAAEPDVRAAVIKAATRLFAAHGFDGTALQDVASAVGVSKPAVLHHFPSKEHIRKAVLDAILEHWQATLPRLLVAATASEERFEAVFGELFRFFTADSDRARVVLREALDRPTEARRLLAGPVRPWIQAIAGYIRAGQASGRHHADVDPEAYVVHMLQLVLAATASAPVTTALLGPGEGESARARYDRELGRVARTSLFTSGPTHPTPQPPDTTEHRAPDRRRKGAR